MVCIGVFLNRFLHVDSLRVGSLEKKLFSRELVPFVSEPKAHFLGLTFFDAEAGVWDGVVVFGECWTLSVQRKPLLACPFGVFSRARVDSICHLFFYPAFFGRVFA